MSLSAFKKPAAEKLNGAIAAGLAKLTVIPSSYWKNRRIKIAIDMTRKGLNGFDDMAGILLWFRIFFAGITDCVIYHTKIIYQVAFEFQHICAKIGKIWRDDELGLDRSPAVQFSVCRQFAWMDATGSVSFR